MSGSLVNILLKIQLYLDIPFFTHIPTWLYNNSLPFSFTFGGVLTDVCFVICHFERERGTNLNASRYSTSPMGGSRPPVQAIFILYPSPRPVPTWEEKNTPQWYRRGQREESKKTGKQTQGSSWNKHQTMHQISPAFLVTGALGYALVLHWFLVLWDRSVISCNLKHQQRTRKLGVIMRCNYLKDTNKSGALKK